MKTKIMHNGKKAVSLLLTIMLILSTLIIGTISVSATISNPGALYFVPSENWQAAGAVFKFAYGTGYNTYIDFKCIDETNKVYRADLGNATYHNFKIARFDPNNLTGDPWNISGDCSHYDTFNYNCLTMKYDVSFSSGWSWNDSNITWSKYTESQQYKFESAPYIAGDYVPGCTPDSWTLQEMKNSTDEYYYLSSNTLSGDTKSTRFKVSKSKSWNYDLELDRYDVEMSKSNGVELTIGNDAGANKTATIKEPSKYDTIEFRAVKATGKVYCVAKKSTATVAISVPTVNNATVVLNYNNLDYAEGTTANVPVGAKFSVKVTDITKGYQLTQITYNNTNSLSTPAKFTAASGATTFTVSISQSVATTVDVKLPSVSDATVKVSYIKADGSAGTVTDDATERTISAKEGSNFTVTVSGITNGKELESIAFGGTTKTSSPATFTASAAGTITVTLKNAAVAEASKWYLAGGMNDWSNNKDNFIKTSTNNTFVLSRYFEAGTYEFKIYNSDNTYYLGSSTENMAATSTYNDKIAEYANGRGSSYNFKWLVSTAGTYTFTFVEESADKGKVTISSVSNPLTATITGEDAVELGKSYTATATATVSDSTIKQQIAYYNYTFQAGTGTPVTSSNVTSTTCNRNIEVTTTCDVYVTVEAFSKSGTCISKSVKASKPVEVMVSDFEVSISANTNEAAVNGTVTLTAAATPLSYVSTTNPYQFQIKGDANDAQFTNIGTASTSRTYTHTFTQTGTYQFRVGVKTKNNPNGYTYSDPVTVNVYANIDEHDVTIYFKSSTTFAYRPYVQLDNGTRFVMEKDVTKPLGTSYSGSVTFAWYKYTFSNVNSAVNHTVRFTTQRTSMNAVISSRCFEAEYYIGVDNLMNGSQVVNLTAEPEYIRNYFRTPLHTVHAGFEDGDLGKTNITDKSGNHVEVAMGEELATNTISVKSATMAQKVSAEVASYSQIQTQVLDVNLDGKVDVMDATQIQKALVSA